MTDDDLEPVQMILEQMSRRFVHSRRMKYMRELEAQHEATVSESAIDDQMEHSDQPAEYLRCVTEMHVRFSEKDKISRQCSDDDGMLVH